MGGLRTSRSSSHRKSAFLGGRRALASCSTWYRRGADCRYDWPSPRATPGSLPLPGSPRSSSAHPRAPCRRCSRGSGPPARTAGRGCSPGQCGSFPGSRFRRHAYAGCSWRPGAHARRARGRRPRAPRHASGGTPGDAHARRRRARRRPASCANVACRHSRPCRPRCPADVAALLALWTLLRGLPRQYPPPSPPTPYSRVWLVAFLMGSCGQAREHGISLRHRMCAFSSDQHSEVHRQPSVRGLVAFLCV